MKQKCQLSSESAFCILLVSEEMKSLCMQNEDIKLRKVKPILFALCQDWLCDLCFWSTSQEQLH